MSRPVKGLMIKDLRLIFSQMKLFLIIIVVWAIFMTVSLEGEFSVGYVALMFSFVTLGTFSYDEAEKGMSYLFTLPIARKDYIKAKYLLGMMITIVPALIVMLFTCILYIITDAEGEFLNYLFSSLITIPAAIFLLVLEIPLYIKFGQEKRRLASLYEMAGGNNMEIIDGILGMDIWLLLVLIILAVIVFTAISYKISCSFLEKKQF